MINKLRQSKKGFTLAELLIVVAIIAILVAIAIPTFTSSLQKARFATDVANFRAEYADAVVRYLEDPDDITLRATLAGVLEYSTVTTWGTDTVTITLTADPNLNRTLDYDNVIILAAAPAGP